MTNKSKKIFLALSIIVPFLLYSIYYYSIMFKNAPYKFSEFDSITFNYGTGDTLLNKYNSKTLDYEYLNTSDSLIKSTLKLNKDDLLYLHRKAAEMGLWDFPANMVSDSSKLKNSKVPRYYIEFKYKRKSKKVVYSSDFDGNPKLKDAVEELIKLMQSRLIDAEKR